MSVYRIFWSGGIWNKTADASETTPPKVTIKGDDISTCEFETKELVFAMEDRIWIEYTSIEGTFKWGGVVQDVTQTKGGWQVKGVDFLQNVARKKVGSPAVPKVYGATYTDFTLISYLLANVVFPSAPAAWLKLKLTTALTGTTIAPVSYTGAKALDIIQEYSRLNNWHYYVRQTAWNAQPELVIIAKQTAPGSTATYPSVSDWKRESSRRSLVNSFTARTTIKDIPENNAWVDNPLFPADHILGWCGMPGEFYTNSGSKVGDWNAVYNESGIVIQPRATGTITAIRAYVQKVGSGNSDIIVRVRAAQRSTPLAGEYGRVTIPASFPFLSYLWLEIGVSIPVIAGKTYVIQLGGWATTGIHTALVYLTGVTKTLINNVYGGGSYWSEDDILKAADILDARWNYSSLLDGATIWAGEQSRDGVTQELYIPNLIAIVGSYTSSSPVGPTGLGWTTPTLLNQTLGYHYADGKRGIVCFDLATQHPTRSNLGYTHAIGPTLDLWNSPVDFEYLEFDLTYLNYYATVGDYSAIKLRDSTYMGGSTGYACWYVPNTGPKVMHFKVSRNEFIMPAGGSINYRNIVAISIPFGAIITNLRFVGRDYSKTVDAVNPTHDRYQTEFEEEETVPWQKPSVIDTYAANVLAAYQSASQVISAQTEITTPPQLFTLVDVDLPIADLAQGCVASDTVAYLSVNAIRDFAVNDYVHVGQGTVRQITYVGANYIQLNGSVGVNMDARGPVFKRFTLACYGYERDFSTDETKLFLDGVPWNIYAALNDMNQRLNRATK